MDIRTPRAYTILAAAGILYSVGAVAQDYAICSAPLQAALMTVRSTTTAEERADAEARWQCSFRFSTHNDAISAGLQIGAVVFGSPLQIGGTFNRGQVDTWKEENCSSASRSSSFESASFNYLREVAPGAMTAFSSCVASLSGRSALSCTLNRSSGFRVSWRRMDGEVPTAAPQVSRFMVSGGSCSPGIDRNTTINEGGNGTPCIALPRSDLSVMIETNRGLCVATSEYPVRVEQLSGLIELTSDRTIEADTVELSDGARIITNGHYLSITAVELRLTGNARVESFSTSPRPNRPPGNDGRGGGTIIIQTERLTGARLVIDGRGENGTAGASGAKGGTGGPGRTGRGNAWYGIEGCRGAVNGTAGEQGRPGGNGGNGGRGGDGASVTIRVGTGLLNGAVRRIDVVNLQGRTIPGEGGEAGPAGLGGDGGQGGAGGTGSGPCGGSDAGPTGPVGIGGGPGQSGGQGTPGAIQISG